MKEKRRAHSFFPPGLKRMVLPTVRERKKHARKADLAGVFKEDLGSGNGQDVSFYCRPRARALRERHETFLMGQRGVGTAKATGQSKGHGAKQKAHKKAPRRHILGDKKETKARNKRQEGSGFSLG